MTKILVDKPPDEISTLALFQIIIFTKSTAFSGCSLRQLLNDLYIQIRKRKRDAIWAL